MPGTNKQTILVGGDYFYTRGKNTTGSSQTVGKIVYPSGATGGQINFAIADNTSEISSSKTIGLLASNVSENANVKVITEGKYKFNGLDTTGIPEGTALWLGTNGNITTTKPVAPAHSVYIGILTIPGNNSTIEIRIQNGYELDELHDVLITSATDGEVLQRESGLWKNKNPTIRNINTQTTSYTLQSTDADKIVSINSATAVNVTISGLIAGQSVKIYQQGAGQITFIAGTLTPRNSFNLVKTAGQYSIVEITVIGTDAVLSGNLA